VIKFVAAGIDGELSGTLVKGAAGERDGDDNQA
jgi:hypothetical protein